MPRGRKGPPQESIDSILLAICRRDDIDPETMENYFEAKAKLFSALGTVRKVGRAVVNADSTYGRELIKRLGGDHAVLNYGVSSAAVIRAEDVRVSAEGSYFVVHTPQGSIPMSLPLIGRYNVSNALAAIGAGELKIDGLIPLAIGAHRQRAHHGDEMQKQGHVSDKRIRRVRTQEDFKIRPQNLYA